MTIVRNSESTITLSNYEEQLEIVENAISACIQNGQQYTIVGSRSKTSVSLSDLRKERTILLRRIDSANGVVAGRNQADNSGFNGNSDVAGQ